MKKGKNKKRQSRGRKFQKPEEKTPVREISVQTDDTSPELLQIASRLSVENMGLYHSILNKDPKLPDVLLAGDDIQDEETNMVKNSADESRWSENREGSCSISDKTFSIETREPFMTRTFPGIPRRKTAPRGRAHVIQRNAKRDSSKLAEQRDLEDGICLDKIAERPECDTNVTCSPTCSFTNNSCNEKGTIVERNAISAQVENSKVREHFSDIFCHGYREKNNDMENSTDSISANDNSVIVHAYKKIIENRKSINKPKACDELSKAGTELSTSCDCDTPKQSGRDDNLQTIDKGPCKCDKHSTSWESDIPMQIGGDDNLQTIDKVPYKCDELNKACPEASTSCDSDIPMQIGGDDNLQKAEKETCKSKSSEITSFGGVASYKSWQHKNLLKKRSFDQWESDDNNNTQHSVNNCIGPFVSDTHDDYEIRMEWSSGSQIHARLDSDTVAQKDLYQEMQLKSDYQKQTQTNAKDSLEKKLCSGDKGHHLECSNTRGKCLMQPNSGHPQNLSSLNEKLQKQLYLEELPSMQSSSSDPQLSGDIMLEEQLCLGSGTMETNITCTEQNLAEKQNYLGLFPCLELQEPEVSLHSNIDDCTSHSLSSLSRPTIVVHAEIHDSMHTQNYIKDRNTLTNCDDREGQEGCKPARISRLLPAVSDTCINSDGVQNSVAKGKEYVSKKKQKKISKSECIQESGKLRPARKCAPTVFYEKDRKKGEKKLDTVSHDKKNRNLEILRKKEVGKQDGYLNPLIETNELGSAQSDKTLTQKRVHSDDLVMKDITVMLPPPRTASRIIGRRGLKRKKGRDDVDKSVKRRRLRIKGQETSADVENTSSCLANGSNDIQNERISASKDEACQNGKMLISENERLYNDRNMRTISEEKDIVEDCRLSDKINFKDFQITSNEEENTVYGNVHFPMYVAEIYNEDNFAENEGMNSNKYFLGNDSATSVNKEAELNVDSEMFEERGESRDIVMNSDSSSDGDNDTDINQNAMNCLQIDSDNIYGVHVNGMTNMTNNCSGRFDGKGTVNNLTCTKESRYECSDESDDWYSDNSSDAENNKNNILNEGFEMEFPNESNAKQQGSKFKDNDSDIGKLDEDELAPSQVILDSIRSDIAEDEELGKRPPEEVTDFIAGRIKVKATKKYRDMGKMKRGTAGWEDSLRQKPRKTEIFQVNPAPRRAIAREESKKSDTGRPAVTANDEKKRKRGRPAMQAQEKKVCSIDPTLVIRPEQRSSNDPDLGHVVWGKLGRQRWWPAVVIEGYMVLREPAEPSTSWLFWFGDHKISLVSREKIVPFVANFEKFFGSKQNGALFKQGVTEAVKVCGERCSYSNHDNQDLMEWALKGFLKDGESSSVENDAFAPSPDQPLPDFVLEGISELRSTMRQKLEDEEDDHVERSIGDALNSVKTKQKKLEDICISCNDLRQEVVYQHPLFVGGLCKECKSEMVESFFAVGDDGTGMFCVVCSNGGKMFVCENEECNSVFCLECVKLFLGDKHIAKIEQASPWTCFLCEPYSPETHGYLIPKEDWKRDILKLFDTGYRVQDKDLDYLFKGEKKKIRVLSLFDGIGTGRVVLDQLGLDIEAYYTSEVDEDSLLVTTFHYGDTVIQLGDVTKITEAKLKEISPIDLLIGGSPCNDLSLANPVRKGFSDFGSSALLFFDFVRVLSCLQQFSQDRHVFWLYENVASMKKEYCEVISRFLQCQPALWDAKYFSAQARPRYFWGNIPGMYSTPNLSDIKSTSDLDDVLSAKCNRKATVKIIRTVTTRQNSLKQGKKDAIFPVTMNGKDDMIWVSELERVFGFPDHYTDVGNIPVTRRRQMIGRAWSVPVVRKILDILTEFFAGIEEKDHMDNKTTKN